MFHLNVETALVRDPFWTVSIAPFITLFCYTLATQTYFVLIATNYNCQPTKALFWILRSNQLDCYTMTHNMVTAMLLSVLSTCSNTKQIGQLPTTFNSPHLAFCVTPYYVKCTRLIFHPSVYRSNRRPNEN